ncbi:transcription/translation regulatory transformer protein RfaH [Kangiella sp. HZ709]|uniref:transcription/translation regulatory transformer protein RfaH n=1 Tax=Kangiella sp. HZ709 TaxID=2666328 RepID=UPI001416D672|nr:transcription/translation regulatory transformer protein RfaH [Kangiella sp. HZ709]
MSYWYLIQAKPKQQLRAKENLENQDVECFYPTIELEKIVRGRRQMVNEPLFSNYIFIKLDDEDINWSKIRSTRGVRDFVRFGIDVAKVPEQLVQQLKFDTGIIDSNMLETNAPREGDKVIITKGAFKEFEGIYQSPSDEERSIILLNILSKTIKLEVANQDVMKVEK